MLFSNFLPLSVAAKTAIFNKTHSLIKNKVIKGRSLYIKNVIIMYVKNKHFLRLAAVFFCWYINAHWLSVLYVGGFNLPNKKKF